MIVLRAIRAFVRFWVDFIVGDDWTVAATVAAALVAAWGLQRVGFPAWWLTPVAVIGIATLSLRRAARRSRRATPRQ